MTPANHPAGCDCFDFVSGGLAPYQTYNWSSTGNGVTRVGYPMANVNHESNRGCAGQNIQACLALAGWSYFDELRFFYGQDIELRRLDGSIVDEPGHGGDAGVDAATDGVATPDDRDGSRPGEGEGCAAGEGACRDGGDGTFGGEGAAPTNGADALAPEDDAASDEGCAIGAAGAGSHRTSGLWLVTAVALACAARRRTSR